MIASGSDSDTEIDTRSLNRPPTCLRCKEPISLINRNFSKHQCFTQGANAHIRNAYLSDPPPNASTAQQLNSSTPQQLNPSALLPRIKPPIRQLSPPSLDLSFQTISQSERPLSKLWAALHTRAQLLSSTLLIQTLRLAPLWRRLFFACMLMLLLVVVGLQLKLHRLAKSVEVVENSLFSFRKQAKNALRAKRTLMSLRARGNLRFRYRGEGLIGKEKADGEKAARSEGRTRGGRGVEVLRGSEVSVFHGGDSSSSAYILLDLGKVRRVRISGVHKRHSRSDFGVFELGLVEGEDPCAVFEAGYRFFGNELERQINSKFSVTFSRNRGVRLETQFGGKRWVGEGAGLKGRGLLVCLAPRQKYRLSELA